MTAGGESTAGNDQGPEQASERVSDRPSERASAQASAQGTYDPAAELARELREARVGAGLSLKELEPLTASSDSSLSRYLSGASVPPWSVVEALYTAAQRDPGEVEPLWEAAQRSRFERRVRGRDGDETEPNADAATPLARRGGAGDGTAQPARALMQEAAATVAGTGIEAGAGAGAEARPSPRRPGPRRLSPRLLVLAGVAVGVVAIAIAVVVAVSPGGAKSSQTTPVRLCPWHYVVTDGDPAPVLIADSPGPNRRHIGIYEPGQVFYVAEPPAVSQGMLKTVDGWITDGGWIQRYSSPCVTVPRASATGSR